MDDAPGLRERTRRAVRAELLREAMRLFLDRGFDATTVEDIAVAAGLSRRSFFRYFASKDEVLAAGLIEVGQGIADAIAARPVDEPPWTALRRGLDSLIARAEGHPNSRELGRLMAAAPTSIGHQRKLDTWQASIAAALKPRLSGVGEERALIASSVAAAGLACFTVAQNEWHGTGIRRSLAELTDIAMSAVRPLR